MMRVMILCGMLTVLLVGCAPKRDGSTRADWHREWKECWSDAAATDRGPSRPADQDAAHFVGSLFIPWVMAPETRSERLGTVTHACMRERGWR